MTAVHKKTNNKTVFVGMSGGVDSSVTAYLLKKQGYRVVGVFMRCYNIDGCADSDARDARIVAEQLGVPFYVWDFEEEYKKAVVSYMIDGYKNGITPNPDVMCNREIKFGIFLKKALALGADFVATGHYVRLANSKERMAYGKNAKPYTLAPALDTTKDQSYFLWTLKQEQLRHCLFPIGEYKKMEVRRIAKKAGIYTAEKKDSQGVCFLGKVNIMDFLQEYIPKNPGRVITTTGIDVGTHDGLAFYTIGQRHTGINFKTPKELTNHLPFYVATKDEKTNTIIVAEGDEHESLFAKKVTIRGISCVNKETETEIRKQPRSVMVRVRYRQPLARAIISEEKNGVYEVEFSTPQKFVALGQSLVFYDKDGKTMLGGGIIENSKK